MALEFFCRAPGRPARLGILPGAFNPPTVAHLALARAALKAVDEVLLVLPRVFPHKLYEGARFQARIEMLAAALAGEPRCSIAAVSEGLFIDIARDCRAAYAAPVRLSFVCGRDAAERIVNWDYGDPGAVARMLEEFDLLVACRDGSFEAPPAIRSRIQPLALDAGYDPVSASEVRRRVAAGEAWERLVPRAIVPLVRRIYSLPLV